MKFNLYQITQHALYKMKKHWEIQTLLCDDEQIKAEALGFQKLITMFIVFIIGILLALSIFLWEILKEKEINNQKAFNESVTIRNIEDVKKVGYILQEIGKLSLNSQDVKTLITIKIMKTTE